MNNEIEVWYSEYELRQFIDTATRWSIEAVYKNRTKERPYSIFTDDIKVARKNFDLFADQLNKKLISTQNRKAIELDLEDRFLKMLNQYINWYEENKESTKIFDKYNPYQLMLSVIESTKKEILKYFPELSLQQNDNTFNLKRIENEIANKQTITDKLNYWHEILIIYFFKPIERKQFESQNNYETATFRDNLIIQLFSNPCWAPYFPIPETIYNKHFGIAISNPELTFWFLDYYAKEFFESRKKKLKSDGGLNSAITIEKEIRRINKLEKDAKEWFLQTEGVNLKTTPTDRYEREKIEIIRVLDKEYYKNYPVSNIHARGGNITIEVYAEHVYLKGFLETKLKELEASGNKNQATPKTVTDYTSQDKNEIISQKPESVIPGSLSFTKNNYEIGIRDWNKKHNNNLTIWLKSGDMIEIEKWLFVNKDRLVEQKAVLNDLYDQINIVAIGLADMHNEIKFICENKAQEIKTTIDSFFAHAKDIQITMPFISLCPKIINQPQYLIEARLKYRNDLSEHETTYYRYKYLENKIGFGKDKFNKYKQNLNRSIRIEVSNNNKGLINSMFLFIEQFIDDLNGLHRTHFSYFTSHLFRLLFDEVIKTKGYYFSAFGHFNFTNILEIEKLLKSAEEFAETDLQVSNHENNLPANDLLDIFHKMIKGNLKPHLINEDNLSEINDLLKTTFYFDEKSETLKTDDKYWSLTTESGQLFEVSLDPDNPDNNTIKLSPDESLETLINLNIPPPPDEKSEAFLNLIEREILLIKAKASSFLKNSNSTKENKLFALKNIQLLKELAEQLHLYIKKLGGEHGNLFITDANHFISYVLKYYLIDAIQFFQKTFHPFTKTKLESSTHLKLILFNESTPRIPEFTILPLLPKNKEFDVFKKNLRFKLNSNREYKPDPSIGEKLFNFYKSKNSDLNQNLLFIEYNKILTFWNNLIITNKLKTIVHDRFINEPEIEKILIPLLKGEIEILEKQVKSESSDSRIITKNNITQSKDKIFTKESHPKKPSIEDDIEKVNTILMPLSGYWNREKIMNKKDFEILKEYIVSIITNNSLPDETKQIPNTNVSNEFISKTIYEIYKYLGKKNRQQFITLIHLFKQFDNTEVSTTQSKLSTYTGDYNNDIDKMISY